MLIFPLRHLSPPPLKTLKTLKPLTDLKIKFKFNTQLQPLTQSPVDGLMRMI